MSEFTKIGTLADMPAENEAKEFLIGYVPVCVARVNGDLCAIDNECIHRGGPLSGGTIENGKVTCPWHGWEFDLKTGQATYPSSAKAKIYPLKIENGEVLVQV